MNETLVQRAWIPRAASALVLLVLAVLLAALLFRGGPRETARSAEHGERYACPMFCVLLDEPPRDRRCPVCAMELEAVAQEFALTRGDRARLALEAVPLARERLELRRTLFGTLAFDARAEERLVARVAGTIERAPAEEGGASAAAGEVLIELSSPALLAAQTDYLVAWRAAGGGRTGVPEVGSTRDYLEAAALRLADLGCDAEELRALRERSSGDGRVRLRAPRAGVVVAQRARRGMAVQPGEELLLLADPARLRVEVALSSDDLEGLILGTRARIELGSGAPALPRGARLAWIAPRFDPSTRRCLARFDLDEAEAGERAAWIAGRGVRVELTLALDARGDVLPPERESEAALALPRETVLRRGGRAVAYALATRDAAPALLRTALPEGELSYRAIELELGPEAARVGSSGAERYVVVRALRDAAGAAFAEELGPGVLFARRPVFLLDAQSELSGAPSLRTVPEAR